MFAKIHAGNRHSRVHGWRRDAKRMMMADALANTMFAPILMTNLNFAIAFQQCAQFKSSLRKVENI